MTPLPPASDGTARRGWQIRVERWARIAAHLVPFTVLPSGIWRIAGVDFHVPLGHIPAATGMPSWLPVQVYVVLLTIASELLAFTAIGLVARWGEVVPRWIPGLGGRRVPPAAAIVPAVIGATALSAMWTVAWATSLAGVTIQGHPLPAYHPLHGTSWQVAAFIGAYAPLLLWGRCCVR